MNKIKKLICTLLAVCIISTTLAQPVQAFTGAEGAILGGGGALASISLTAPQVALLVAAGFGVVVAVENADKLAEGMTAALDAAAAGVDAGAETLSQWLETAKKGSIAIASAPVWISAAIKGWISNLYHAVPAEYACPNGVTIPSGSVIPDIDFWGTDDGYTANVDVICLYAGSISLSDDGTEYKLRVERLLTAPTYSWRYISSSGTYKKATLKVTSDYPEYFSISTSWISTVSVSTTSPYDKAAIESVRLLPDIDTLNAKYNTTSTNYSLMKEYFSGNITSSASSVCPDAKVGGIGAALEEGKSIDDVNMPDLDVTGSKSICPDGVLDGSIPIADTVADVIVGLTDGTLSWSDYVSDVAVGTPSISVPVEGTETGVVDYPITDTGVSDVPIEDTPDKPGQVEVPEGLAPYTVQLKDFFPFCIPFDIVDFVGVLCADPVAPAFDWTFTQYNGQKDTLTIDLSPFDDVAQLLRNMELLLFIIGLAFLTRNLIRG